MDAFLTEVFVFVGIGTLVVLLRLFLRTRQAGVQNLQADDYLMLAAIIIFIAVSGMVYVVGVTYQGLSNSGMTNDERFALDPISEEYHFRVAGSQIAVAAAVAYVTQLWLVKASADLKGFKIRVKMGFVLIASTYIALICTILFSCRLFYRLWQIYPNPGLTCQPALSRVYLLTIVILNLSTDLYLVLIPLPMVWKARLPICKRLGLLVLFSGALFVMIAVVLRCVLTLTNSIADTKRTAIWKFRECFVALIASNLPMLWAWIRHEVKPTTGLHRRPRNRWPHKSIMLANCYKGSIWHCRRIKPDPVDDMAASSPTALRSFDYGDREDLERRLTPQVPSRKVHIYVKWQGDGGLSILPLGDGDGTGQLPTTEER